MENAEEERALLEAAGLPAGENRVLLMKDAGAPVGHIVVALEGEELRLRRMCVNDYNFTVPPQGEVLFILDTLMRAAASWGEDHGARRIATDFPDFFGFFKARGFETDPAGARTPMETIVRYERGV